MQCALLLISKYGRKRSEYRPTEFLQPYADFMTGAGTHGDTYADTFHRQFFTNFHAGHSPSEELRGGRWGLEGRGWRTAAGQRTRGQPPLGASLSHSLSPSSCSGTGPLPTSSTPALCSKCASLTSPPGWRPSGPAFSTASSPSLAVATKVTCRIGIPSVPDPVPLIS